jgi:hypothetical protein
VLTSADTFSGGEELAYNLKVLGRGTLVGEPTKGGAHPTTVLPLSATLEITLPFARSINPVTGPIGRASAWSPTRPWTPPWPSMSPIVPRSSRRGVGAGASARQEAQDLLATQAQAD